LKDQHSKGISHTHLQMQVNEIVYLIANMCVFHKLC